MLSYLRLASWVSKNKYIFGEILLVCIRLESFVFASYTTRPGYLLNKRMLFYYRYIKSIYQS